MREILFRGKCKDNGKWVYGYYSPANIPLMGCVGHFINEGGYRAVEVDPETVGQYTGLNDNTKWEQLTKEEQSNWLKNHTVEEWNGKKIFEGDIVTAKDEVWGSPFCDGITGKIVYDETAYFIEPKNPMESQRLFNECAVYEVIGNIHDNPELLESEVTI